MLNNKFVSVIINCRNSQDFLKDCLDSVLKQSYNHFEIILIDNQSSDNTKKIIFSYEDKRIKYFVTNEFLSLGAARNFALSKCNGEYLAFIDSDDIWEKDKLNYTINKFKNGVGLVYSDVTYFNEEKSFNLYSHRRVYTGDCFEQLLHDYNLCMSSCVVSNAIIRKNNIKFDPRLKVCEDLDFFLKISYLSKISYVDKILVKYRIHNDNLSSKNLILFYEEYEVTIKNLTKLFNIGEDKFIKALDLNLINKSKFLWKKNKIKNAFRTLSKVRILLLKRILYSMLILVPYKFIRYIYGLFFVSKIEFNDS